MTTRPPPKASTTNSAAEPWTLLRAIASDSLAAVRDRALNAFGLASALRRSELVALTVADIERVPDGLRVRVARSKMDQQSKGDPKAVSMPNIARALGNRGVVDALVAECAAQWGALHLGSLEDIPEKDRATVAEAARRSEEAFRREQGEGLRQRAAEAIVLIAEYDARDARHGTLCHLITLRDRHLAHRQLRPQLATVDPVHALDKAVERFFGYMVWLIHLLRLVAEGTDYRPQETAEFRRRHAKMFWASVRGEQTEGNPDYTPPKGGGP